MNRFVIRTVPDPQDPGVADAYTTQLMETLPAEGQQRIRESARKPRINPLVNPAVKDGLALIAKLEDDLEAEKAAHIENRGPLRALCDAFLNTGKEAQFIKKSDAERVLARVSHDQSPREALEALRAAGLIDVKDFIPLDRESAVSTMASYHQIVAVTDRGRTLLTTDKQPALLLAP